MKKLKTPPVDEIVLKLSGKDKLPPRSVLLQGYVGISTKKDCIRLFFDPTLRNYLDIPEGDILYYSKIKSDTFDLAGTLVWVSEDSDCVAPMAFVRGGSRPVENSTLLCGRTQHGCDTLPACGPGNTTVQATCQLPSENLSCHTAEECPNTSDCTTRNCYTDDCPPPETSDCGFRKRRGQR